MSTYIGSILDELIQCFLNMFAVLGGGVTTSQEVEDQRQQIKDLLNTKTQLEKQVQNFDSDKKHYVTLLHLNKARHSVMRDALDELKRIDDRLSNVRGMLVNASSTNVSDAEAKPKDGSISVGSYVKVGNGTLVYKVVDIRSINKEAEAKVLHPDKVRFWWKRVGILKTVVAPRGISVGDKVWVRGVKYEHPFNVIEVGLCTKKGQYKVVSPDGKMRIWKKQNQLRKLHA